MIHSVDLSGWVAFGGFLLAFMFGIVASMSNFCTMGAISDVVNMQHWGRMRMWLLTVTVALAGTGILQYLDLIDVSRSIYHRATLPWLSLTVGGVAFGMGMTLAGGCVNKNLLRFGAGSLRSMVVLTFIALSAYMTLKGLLGQWRAAYLDPVGVDLSASGLHGVGLADAIAAATGVSKKAASLLTAGLIAAVLVPFIFANKRFRSNPKQVLGAASLGLLVCAGWYLTGHLGYAENADTLEMTYFGTNSHTIESLSFVAPSAYSMELLLMWTDKSLKVTFGIASVAGVVLGSLAHALGTGQFRWEGFASLADLRTQLAGAILMGFGGVSAMGCTIGQGLSGLSSLAVGSCIAVASIVAGSVAVLKWQQLDPD